MADILYTYKDQAYANITNKCDCRCRFCIRSHENAVGDAENLWHRKDPTLDEILKAMREFDFTGFHELVYCGYGEPTCALSNLVASARFARENYGLSIRVNTNGLGNLYHKKDIVPILSEVADCVSISLNAPTSGQYNEVTRPQFPDAFDALMTFTSACREQIPSVRLTVVDVLPPEDIAASQQLADRLGVALQIRKYA